MSVTGQIGHVAFAKQTAQGTPNTTGGQYKAVKITGDSLVASNNPLTAEGEIGAGRDVTQSVPGGFSSAGAINGNLRARSAAVLLQGVLGTRTEIAANGGATPPTAATDEMTPADDLPWWTIEKKVGTTNPELLVLRYEDAMVNTLSLSCPSGGLATFNAGLIAVKEGKQASATATPSYPATGDELLVFHGGRIRQADATVGTLTASHDDGAFQSLEVSINNNIAADEFTIRPSRYLRSLTEGIRNIELNMTIVFDDNAKYEKYAYGATGNVAPGAALYMAHMSFFLGNWQINSAENIDKATLTGGPTSGNPQAFELDFKRVAFNGFPVALSSGRIAVSTTARVLYDGTNPIVKAIVRPQRAGLDYA